MRNLRPFQIVLFGFFIVMAIGGLIGFSLFGPSGSSDEKPFGDSVEIWGTFDSGAFNGILNKLSQADENFRVVSYVEKNFSTFDLDLVNAIAEGRAPDLVILSHESLVKHRAKLLALSYELMPRRAFRDTYIDGAEIFMLRDGVYGVPFAVDPMVMYWNRDIFSSSGLSNPPSTWESLVSSVVPRVTNVTGDLDVVQSALSFGEYSNVENAKSILSMLFLQSGINIITESDRSYEVSLVDSNRDEEDLSSGGGVLSFYTQFANPSNNLYSWNRSLQRDRLKFLAGELGLYFGFGSDLQNIIAGNPNLNFDVSEVPQGDSATIKRTFGKFYAFSIPKTSDNVNGAFRVAQILAGEGQSGVLPVAIGLTPVLRSEIAKGTPDPNRQVLYNAALTSRGWLDPDPTASENVFKIMTEDVTSGRVRISQAINDAVRRLQLLF